VNEVNLPLLKEIQKRFRGRAKDIVAESVMIARW